MKILIKILSIAGLVLTLVPAFLVFSQELDLATSKNLMLIGTILWFASAPFAFGKKEAEA
jgi:uncharacterized membrane protein